jgi:nucleoside-diphosphate-sugar epimerase
MKVLVAGATGALGRPLVKALISGGHQVIGMTRSRPEVVESLGGTAAVADALDAEAVGRAVEGAGPDAIVHNLTAIPRKAITMPRDLKETNRLRIEGTKNLIDAARATGVKRIVAQSITFAFDGKHESSMRPLTGMGSFQKAVDAAVSLENQVVQFPGTVLRYGYFYGAGTAPTELWPKALKRRMLAILGKGMGLWSFIHMDDAATATLAALEWGRDGEIYNVCDDEPIPASDALGIVSQSAGVPKPLRLPEVGPYFARHFFNKSTGASNDKAKSELNWSPRFPTFREGYPATLGE